VNFANSFDVDIMRGLSAVKSTSVQTAIRDEVNDVAKLLLQFQQQARSRSAYMCVVRSNGGVNRSGSVVKQLKPN
jgi:hypothetical protein